MTAVRPLPVRRQPATDALGARLQGLGCLLPETARPRAFRSLLFGRRERSSRASAMAPGASPVSPRIRELIARLPTGGWSIRPETAHALAVLFQTTLPRRVLEFGSGASTVLLAALCAEAGGGQVVSLDEKPSFAARTRLLLEEAGLSRYATTLVAPVSATTVEGWSGHIYRPERDAVRRALAGERVGFVFVDGPANWLGRRGDCRFGTLPLARGFVADEAVFAADDALRRRDHGIVMRWRSLPYIDVCGILPVGRGLAVGIVRGV
jgi:hypothetical protein